MKTRQTLPPEERRFRLFALGQGLIWLLLPSLLFHNLPLDVVEGLAWGHAWPLGTYKHPPLQAWLLEIAAILGGRTDTGIYALSAACLVLTYGAVWKLGKHLLPPQTALMGVMALCGCIYFTTTIPEFNPNVVQIPVYALCGLFFWRAFEQDRWRDWLLLGLFAGLGLWGKYSFIFMLLGFVVFMIWEPRARQIWYRAGAWAAVLVALLIFAPHLLWLVEHHWLPFDYARSRAAPAENFLQSAGWALRFVGNQLLVIAPVVLLCRLAGRKRAFAWPEITPGMRYLTALAWAPFLMIVLTVLVMGDKPRDMWGMALWPFIGLWFAARWNSDWSASVWARRAFYLALLAMPVALTSGALLTTPLGFRPWRTEFLGRELAATAEQLWRAQGWKSPPSIVMSDNWFGGNVAWYGEKRLQVSYFGKEAYSPWVSDDMIRKQGAIVVWDAAEGREDLPKWALMHGGVGGKTVIRLRHGQKDMPLAIGFLAPEE